MEKDMDPQLSTCRSGCGFFGSSATDGLCSKCFKDSLKRKQDTNRMSPTSLAPISSSSLRNNSPPKSSEIDQAVDKICESESSQLANVLEGAKIAKDNNSKEDAQQSTAPKKPNRCHTCNKRVGLTGFSCRCEGMFCGEHRYSDAHACSFDYKTTEREELRKNNPVVVSDKIQRL